MPYWLIFTYKYVGYFKMISIRSKENHMYFLKKKLLFTTKIQEFAHLSYVLHLIIYANLLSHT